MINEFERSESARSVVGYIEKLTGAHSLVVNQAVYTLIRDFLLLEITIANAHRSGVLANMTVGEFKAAKEKQDSIVISVKKHKTADTHGPENENESDEAYVFLSWNGAKMESGQICTAINAAWGKGGMQGHISSTLFRKSAVTNVHARHNELRSDLADLMAHKETTAQRFYRLKEKEEACLQAASNLPRIMRLSNQKEMENQPEAAGTKSDDGASGTVGDKNTAVESFKERIEWKEEEVIALRKVSQGHDQESCGKHLYLL